MKVFYAITTIMVIMLLVCLFKVPYYYFWHVKIIVSSGCIWMAYQNRKNWTSLVYLSCATTFQPLFKASFNRITWNIIDVMAAVLLIICVFVLHTQYNANKKKNTPSY